MTDAASFARAVARQEPSFREEAPFAGTFRIGPRKARLRWEEGRWLVGTVPASGSAADLLWREKDFLAPVKAVPGPEWKAELPYRSSRDGVSEIVPALTSALRKALGARVEDGARSGPRLEDLAEHLEPSSFEWSKPRDRLLIRLDDDPSGASLVRAEAKGGVIVLNARLGRFGAAPPECLEALGHFLMALNDRLRLARGVLGPERDPSLEVVLPGTSWIETALGDALGALAAGLSLARRECAALLHPQIARQYVHFHRGGNA